MCSKCKAKYFKEVAGLECCVICGTLKITPVMEQNIVQQAGVVYEPRQPYVPSMVTQNVVEQHLEKVIEMRRLIPHGRTHVPYASWDAVTRMLMKSSGRKLQPNTVRKYAVKAGIQ